MSKIVVDEMPTEASQCPFRKRSSIMCGCTLKGPGEFCSLEYDASCRFLKELPKGDKANGSEED